MSLYLFNEQFEYYLLIIRGYGSQILNTLRTQQAGRNIRNFFARYRRRKQNE